MDERWSSDRAGEPVLLLCSIRDVKKHTPTCTAPAAHLVASSSCCSLNSLSIVRQFLCLLPLGHSQTCFFKSFCTRTKKEDMTIEVIHPHKQGCFLMCSQHTTTQLSITADTGSYGAELSWLRGLYLSTSASYSNFQALLLEILDTTPPPPEVKSSCGCHTRLVPAKEEHTG